MDFISCCYRFPVDFSFLWISVSCGFHLLVVAGFLDPTQGHSSAHCWEVSKIKIKIQIKKSNKNIQNENRNIKLNQKIKSAHCREVSTSSKIFSPSFSSTQLTPVNHSPLGHRSDFHSRICSILGMGAQKKGCGLLSSPTPPSLVFSPRKDKNTVISLSLLSHFTLINLRTDL